MPVRRIGLCYRSVSGRVPMGGGRPSVSVESTLERDFVLLRRFDPEVAAIEEQPVRVEYPSGGILRAYIPDFLVFYRDSVRQPELVEVKPASDPGLRSGLLKERLAAARDFAARRGWVFLLATEREIRTPRLGNATFLLPYRDRAVAPNLRELLLMAAGAEGATVQKVTDDVARTLKGDPRWVLPAVWTLIARFEIVADLDRPVSMRSPLQIPAEAFP